MMPEAFDFPEWLDRDSESLCLMGDAPDEIKKAFDVWKRDIHDPFTEQKKRMEGVKIDDLI